jgi:hypothetical protein
MRDLQLHWRWSAWLPILSSGCGTALRARGGAGGWVAMRDQGNDPDGWKKSTISGGGNECVEVRIAGHEVLVRHSMSPDGPILAFSPDEWTEFIDAIRSGEITH